MNDQNNIVSGQQILSKKIFDSWQAAVDSGYKTRNQWRKRGKGVQGRVQASIEWMGKSVALYPQSQTTRPKPRTAAILELLDRFVVRTDIFGYQPYRSHDAWLQISNYPWNVKGLIRQGFNHRKCHDGGIAVGSRITAQAFSIRCQERTDFFVIDVDCHEPGPNQVAAHLELVAILQKELPGFLDQLHGGSMFYQYRQIDTSGIQFWAMLNWKPDTVFLQAKVREFLLGLETNHPGLDGRLTDAKLAGLKQIEIKPTQMVQVSMPGCYGKTIFTDRELKLVDGWVDVVASAEHIQNLGSGGNVLSRYGELLQLACDDRDCNNLIHNNLIHAAEVPTKSPEPVILSSPTMDQPGQYWTNLKQIALIGVSTPDNLYQEYLQPLAQCLYFRDFFHERNRQQLVVDELVSWVMTKHNGLVSRIIHGKEHQVRLQCHRTVQQLENKTCQTIKDYYQSILINDSLYPSRVEHLYDYMRAVADPTTSFLIYCKCSKSNSDRPDDPSKRPLDDSPLPEIINEKIETIGNTLRKGKVRLRFKLFARRFINATYAKGQGEKHIHWQHLNAMMGKLGLNNRQTQDRYKELLVKNGIIKPGWEKFIRRGNCSSRYQLSEVVINELRTQRGNGGDKTD